MPKPDAKNAYTTLTFNSYGKIRNEKLDGVDYRVLPVVLITTGVFQGNHGALRYTENHLGRFPQGWNNKPVLLGHPNSDKGAGHSSVLESQSLGILLNSKYEDGKLKSEAWLKESRLALDDRLEPAIKSGLPIPVSTGLFHDIELTTNSAGEEDRAVCNIVPDHLAVLLDEDPACSITAGAGLLMNAKGEATKNSLVAGDLREQLVAALRSRFVSTISGPYDSSLYVEDFFFDPKVVIFELQGTLYKLGYSSDGDIISLDEGTPEKVMRQRQYMMETGAIVGTTNNSQGNKDMTKATLIAGILAAPGNRLTDAQLNAMDESVLTALTPIPPEAPAIPVTANSAPAVPSVPAQPQFNFQQMLAAAPPDVREMIQDGITTNQAARTRMIQEITANSASSFTAEELAAMKTDQLRKIHSLSASKVPEAAPTSNALGSMRFIGATGAAPVTTPTENAAPTPLLPPAWNTPAA